MESYESNVKSDPIHIKSYKVRDSCRTFAIPAGRSRFRPDVRNSGWTFEIPAGRSEKWKWKERWKVGKRASRISRWSKVDLRDMNIHIPGSKISKNIQKRYKKYKKKHIIVSYSFWKNCFPFSAIFYVFSYLHFSNYFKTLNTILNLGHDMTTSVGLRYDYECGP